MSYDLYGNLKALAPHNYLALTTQLQDKEVNGFIMFDTVIQDISEYQLLYFQRRKVKDGPRGWALACSNSLETMYCRAISIGNALAGELCPILIYGGIRFDGWNFVNEQELFVSNTIPGGITNTAPQEPGHIIQHVATIEANNQAFFTFPPVWLWNLEEYT